MATGPTDVEALQRQIAQLQAELAAAQQANLTGAGALAQGGGTALGERAVHVEDNSGTINTGSSIATRGGAVIAGAVRLRNGHFIGRDLIQIITQVVPHGADPEEAKSAIALYLEVLATELAGLKLGEIDSSVDDPRRELLQLADIYVPLDTTLRIPQEMTLAHWLSRAPRRQDDPAREPRETRPVSALEALAAHRELTLLGKPGSGKSTFGASVLLAQAQAWQGQADALGALGETWTHATLLPIRVLLRRFAEQLPPGDQPARAGDLWDFIARDLIAAGYGLPAAAMDHVRHIAGTAGGLILLDGLDECGERARRERVLAAVHEFKATAGRHCRFILTARPYAWPGGPDPERGVYALADLDDDQIERFIRAWYQALVRRGWRSPGEVERKVTDLLAARHRPELLPLARNPLLLTLMATLHTNRGRLPEDRADLYDESVELLMLRWNRQIGADRALLEALAIPRLRLSDLREVLEEVAFRVHEQSVDRDGAADLGEDRLVRAFCPLLDHSRDKAGLVVEYIEKRAGLLIGQGERDGERQFSFPHRSFQEFLAACHLAAQEDFPAECRRVARAAPGHWQLVLALAARLAKAERGASAADELIGGSAVAECRRQRTPDPADWASALLAAMQLQEIGLAAIQQRERTRAIRARVADWLVASLPVHTDQGGLPARQRAQAGDLLAVLGDPRFDAERFWLPGDDWLGFVWVPADPGFRIGTRPSDRERVAKIIGYKVSDDEINDALTPTPGFYIARYPVTVAQFRAFIEATGVEPGDPDALRDPDSRPVRYVDWHEALAYCRWLNEALASGSVPAGCEAARLVREGSWQVALPSELEWEKAAQGGLREAVYSWGNTPDPNQANYGDSEIGDTSAVGCFPPNGFGLHDMIGNVWEWTRSRYASYPYRSQDGRENPKVKDEDSLVVRGGSWGRSPDVARCAYRGRDLPGYRNGGLGFRVVLRSAPVS